MTTIWVVMVDGLVKAAYHTFTEAQTHIDRISQSYFLNGRTTVIATKLADRPRHS